MIKEQLENLHFKSLGQVAETETIFRYLVRWFRSRCSGVGPRSFCCMLPIIHLYIAFIVIYNVLGCLPIIITQDKFIIKSDTMLQQYNTTQYNTNNVIQY